jgi:hypothetical protein
VWAYVIERRHPAVARTLLRSQVMRRAIFEVEADVDVHPLMGSIVGRPPGAAPHHADAGATLDRG